LSCILPVTARLVFGVLQLVGLRTVDFLAANRALVGEVVAVTTVPRNNVLAAFDTLAVLTSIFALGATSNGVGFGVVTSATLESLGKLPVLVASLLASCHVHHPI
jgi:hypothetical protein